MIPNYQTLMRPVLECASEGEAKISNVVELLANKLNLTDEERAQLLPSGKQTTFANRVHWARSYLKQAGLVRNTRRAHYEITERGKHVLANPEIQLNVSYLEKFEEFIEFQTRGKDSDDTQPDIADSVDSGLSTPDEILRAAHKEINQSLAKDLLDQVRRSTPLFFELLIVELLVAMGYGGTSENAGRALGKSGDDGIDGVIDQDPLGVDQIYLQAKRYHEGNNVGSGALRDFFGALSLKKATKGIFVTTSKFSPSAIRTANDLGSRIVLIDGDQLTKLMIRYNIGCRDEEILHLKKLDESYFDAD